MPDVNFEKEKVRLVWPTETHILRQQTVVQYIKAYITALPLEIYVHAIVAKTSYGHFFIDSNDIRVLSVEGQRKGQCSLLSQQGGWYTVVDAKFYNMINDLASVDTGNQILWQEESRLTSTATEQMTCQLSILRNFINLSMTSLLF